MPDSYFADQAADGPYSPQELFERSLDLLCVAGLDGYFKKVNPSWTRVLGWTREELLARPTIELVHPEDRAHTMLARDHLANDPHEDGVRLVNRYRCKDGSYRWLSWQSIATRANDTVFGVARDVTAERQAAQLRETTSRLESTALFAGGIAHDFNNLLTTLLLSLELVEESGPLNPEQADNLRQARDTALSTRTLTRLLTSLSDGSNHTRERGDLPSLLAQAVADVPSAGVSVSCHAPDSLPPLVLDRPQVLQALKQVLQNAVEASPAGGTVSVSAEMIHLPPASPAKLPPGRYVRIRISDEGPGIPAEHLPKVFDPYFSTKPRGVQKGMGLGLAISHAVLRKHHGAISFDTHAPTGTTVLLHLPVDATRVEEDGPVFDLDTLRGSVR